MVTEPLRELWDRLDPGPAPVAFVVTEGTRLRSRSRWARSSMAAAAVVLALAGASAISSIVDDGSQPEREAATLPAPPDGARWVGLGQAVVAVPDWWTTGETRCGTPVEDTVYFDNGAIYDCNNPPPATTAQEVSALAVLDADNGYGRSMVDSMTPTGTVDGREVLESEECEEWFEGVCRRLFAVPSEGVVFAVTVADPSDASYEEIRESLHILPESMTTVPLRTLDGWTPSWGADPETSTSLVDALNAAGLEVVLDTVEPPDPKDTVGMVADFDEGTLLDVAPALGSPIQAGGTVTVTVAGGDPARETDRPEALEDLHLPLDPDGPACSELESPLPPAPASPIRPIPEADARHTAFDQSGTVAAWFDQTSQLPELVVYDLDDDTELAREDLGVGDVAAEPSLRIMGEAVCGPDALD